MDKFYIYQINITLVDGRDWCQLFVGFPIEDEVLIAINEALEALEADNRDTEHPSLSMNTYRNYLQLINEQGLPDKPKAYGDTIRVCTYAGVTVGHIKAKALGYACDTIGACDDC